MIIFAEFSEEGATSIHFIGKAARRPYRGRFSNKTKNHLTLATSMELKSNLNVVTLVHKVALFNSFKIEGAAFGHKANSPVM